MLAETGGASMFTTLIIVLVALVLFGLRIVQQYERGVVFRFGRITGKVKEPGLRVIILLVDVMRKANMQIITMPIPSQKDITKDNVSTDVALAACSKAVGST